MKFSKEINSLYAYDSVLDQMHAVFKQSNFILLKDFLNKETYKKMESNLLKASWTKNFSADKFSYDFMNSTSDNFFLSEDFALYLSSIIGRKVKKIKISALRFGHRDFELVHDDQEAKERTEFVFFLGDWKKIWGGYKAYTLGDGEPLIIDPTANSLFLIRAPEGMHSFMKYVNHHAGNNKLFVLSGEVN